MYVYICDVLDMYVYIYIYVMYMMHDVFWITVLDMMYDMTI